MRPWLPSLWLDPLSPASGSQVTGCARAWGLPVSFPTPCSSSRRVSPGRLPEHTHSPPTSSPNPCGSRPKRSPGSPPGSGPDQTRSTTTHAPSASDVRPSLAPLLPSFAPPPASSAHSALSSAPLGITSTRGLPLQPACPPDGLNPSVSALPPPHPRPHWPQPSLAGDRAPSLPLPSLSARRWHSRLLLPGWRLQTRETRSSTWEQSQSLTGASTWGRPLWSPPAPEPVLGLARPSGLSVISMQTARTSWPSSPPPPRPSLLCLAQPTGLPPPSSRPTRVSEGVFSGSPPTSASQTRAPCGRFQLPFARPSQGSAT